MKIAFPTNGDNLEAQIEQHFGRAKNYLIYNDKTKEFKIYLNPETSGGKESPPNFLKRFEVEVVITFALGQKAIDKFRQMNIKVYKAIDKNIISNIETFEKKQLIELGSDISDDDFLLK